MKNISYFVLQSFNVIAQSNMTRKTNTEEVTSCCVKEPRIANSKGILEEIETTGIVFDMFIVDIQPSSIIIKILKINTNQVP